MVVAEWWIPLFTTVPSPRYFHDAMAEPDWLIRSGRLSAEAWAEVKAVRGSIYAAGVQVGEGPTHRITMRYRDATGFDHVSLGSQRWRVRDARDPDGRRRVLEVMAEELTPQ